MHILINILLALCIIACIPPALVTIFGIFMVFWVILFG